MRPEGPAQTAPMRARPRASRAGGRFHAPRRSLRSRPFMRSGIATDGTIARRLGGQSRRRPCRTRRHAARTASAAVRSCGQETATDGTVARAGEGQSRAGGRADQLCRGRDRVHRSAELRLRQRMAGWKRSCSPRTARMSISRDQPACGGSGCGIKAHTAAQALEVQRATTQS